MHDPYGLERFVEAQDLRDGYLIALDELRAGHKQGHWMWFVFPQLAGLGHSLVAKHYAISGLPEAGAYFSHGVLGRRLIECAGALLTLPAADPVEILGPVDAMKLRSSMTLFALAAPREPVFRAVLDQYFAGQPDEATTDLLTQRNA